MGISQTHIWVSISWGVKMTSIICEFQNSFLRVNQMKIKERRSKVKWDKIGNNISNLSHCAGNWDKFWNFTKKSVINCRLNFKT